MKNNTFAAGITAFVLVLFLSGCAANAVFLDKCGSGNYAGEFTGLIGQRAEKVTEKFGKPDSISVIGGENKIETWNYKMPCLFCQNPCRGDLNIEFSDGVVRRISYF